VQLARVSQLSLSTDCLFCGGDICLFFYTDIQALFDFPASEPTSSLNLQHFATISSAKAVNLDAIILQ
jgi:hypothetical protein